MSQIDAPAHPFDKCREGQRPRQLATGSLIKKEAPC